MTKDGLIVLKMFARRCLTGLLIYFWVYFAWALGGLIIALPLIAAMILGAPVGGYSGILKFVAILPLVISPFIVTSDTFRSIVGALLDRAGEEETSA